MISSSRREAHAASVAASRELLDRVHKESFYRLNTCRQKSKSESLSGRDVALDMPGTIQLGFVRALTERFSAEKGLDQKWWVQQRRGRGRTGKDTSVDSLILLDHYPEFESYYPDTPLTDDEIVAGAVAEFSRWISAPGTDYRELERRRRLQRDGVGPVVDHVNIATTDGTISLGRFPAGTTVGKPSLQAGREFSLDFLDRAAHERIDQLLPGEASDDEGFIFGRYLNRVALLAIREYGPVNGLYWFCERFFLQKKYSDVLRVLNGGEDEMGVAEFERVKKHMTRNLPIMTERMLEILRNDPVMLELKSERRETGKTVKTSPALRERIDTEKKRSLRRNHDRLVAKLASDGKTKSVLKWFRSLPREQMEKWVEQYRGTGGNELRWQDLRKQMMRRAAA